MIQLGKLVNVSVKVSEETRKRMKRMNIDWSGYLRDAIETKIRMEAAREAERRLGEIRRRARKVPTEELVKWIREDRERSLR